MHRKKSGAWQIFGYDAFGIHVARMAGMPQTIVERANEILKTLEEKSVEGGGLKAEGAESGPPPSTLHPQPSTENLKKKVKNIAAPLQLRDQHGQRPRLERAASRRPRQHDRDLG